MASNIASNVIDADESAIQKDSVDRINSLAVELINSALPIQQMSQFQEVIAAHAKLQPAVQNMTSSNPLIERMNSQTTANLDTIVDSIEGLRSTAKICKALGNEKNLSQETVGVINTEGQSLVSKLSSICTRTVKEVQKNTQALQKAIAEDERTRDDPVTNQLLQQQLQITTNISPDPRQAYQQIQQAKAVGDGIKTQVEKVVPNKNDTVVKAADRNSQYLKYAVGVFFVGAAVVAMCASIVYLAPIVISTVAAAASKSGVGGAAITIGGGFVATATFGAGKDKNQ